MPNWCYNELTITGSTENIDRFLEEAGVRNEKGVYSDINEDAIIPKPYETIKVKLERNNYENELTIAPIEIAEAFNNTNRMIGISGAHGEYDYYIPIGYAVFDWYNWQITNYGCKWGFCDGNIYNIEDIPANDTKVVSYRCSTAWSVPNGLVREMCVRFQVDIEMWSEEEGCSFFLKSNYDYWDDEGVASCDETVSEYEDSADFLIARDGYGEDDVKICLHCGTRVIPDVHDWDEELQACFSCYDNLDWLEDGEEKDELRNSMLATIAEAQKEGGNVNE